MKVFVTKYALTQGIQEIEVEECENTTMVASIPAPGSYKQYFHGEGKDWHRQRWQAEARAGQMRKKKIESLRKSILKLEKMKF